MLLKQRDALHDERNAGKREDYEELQNQYSSLSTGIKRMAIRINLCISFWQKRDAASEKSTIHGYSKIP